MGEKSTPLLAVLQLLRKYNLKGTEEILRKEASLGDVEYENLDLPEVELASILSSHHTESDPYSYEFAYDSLKKFVENSLDMYKHELSTLLYPVFVHMYLSLILYDHNKHAQNFIDKFGPEQEDYYLEDLKKLSIVKNKDQIKGNELAEIYSSNKFVVQLSRDASTQLKRYLHEQKSSTVVINIINNHIQLDVHDGPGRTLAQVRATAGGLLGEATRSENRAKVYYGLLKEPDIQVLPAPVEDEEEPEETPDKPKKKKAKKDNIFMKKPKSDPNAPPNDRIPLPELKETDKLEKSKALREASKRVALGPELLPSICFYTLLNSGHTATCADICDDSSLLAVGFNNSTIKVSKALREASKHVALGPELLPSICFYALLKSGHTAICAEICDDFFLLAWPLGLITTIKFSKTLKEEFKLIALGPELLPSICFYTLLKSGHTAICADICDDSSFLAWPLGSITTIKFSKALKEASKLIALGPDLLPSICFYTLLKSGHTATCVHFCDDSSLLVWTLTPVKLRGMKSAEKLQDIDREAGDVLVRMMEERDRDTCRTLFGHAGPVYKVGFDPFKTMLLSSSEDATVRLWSLQCWTCLVVYRGHVWPVWDVRWSPHGHYFASSGHDRTARLWATDHHQPLRIFAGHLSDVDCIQFHPNSNYIATGSSDRTVRVWDCMTGTQVRIMTGHKSGIYTLVFSICGRWLASGGGCGELMVWDLSTGMPAATLPLSHTAAIHAVAFSRDGTILSSGSLDCTIKLWDFTAITEEATGEENGNTSVTPKEDKLLLRSFATKNSPIKNLHFTRRNLLLAVGTYEGSS